MMGWTDWSASPRDPCLPSTGIAGVHDCSQLFCECYGSDTGSYASTASSLLAVISPQPPSTHLKLEKRGEISLVRFQILAHSIVNIKAGGS